MLADNNTVDLPSVVAQWVANIQEVDRMLAPLAGTSTDTNQKNYEAWKANADYFVELSDRALEDETTFEDWKKVGQNILAHANDLVQLIDDATIAGRIRSFIISFPSSLKYVATTVADTTVGAVGSIIPWYVWVAAAGIGGLILWDTLKKKG